MLAIESPAQWTVPVTTSYHAEINVVRRQMDGHN